MSNTDARDWAIAMGILILVIAAIFACICGVMGYLEYRFYGVKWWKRQRFVRRSSPADAGNTADEVSNAGTASTVTEELGAAASQAKHVETSDLDPGRSAPAPTEQTPNAGSAGGKLPGKG